LSRLRDLAWVSWTGLALGLTAVPSRAADGGTVRAGERFLVLSRHSGEVLAGEDFPIHALGASSARALADLVRIETAAGRSPPWSAADLVARVDEDRIVVGESRASVPPRGRADSAAEVQVFGLVGSDRVSIRCPGRGVRIDGDQVENLPSDWQTLRTALGTGTILCAGGPWDARVADANPRPYAGTFSFRPLPEGRPDPGTTAREARARRGSEVIFHTTLGAYVSGVLAAEDSGLTGEPAVALAEVIAHDARVERHRGRPLCDTTHCQAFLGTAAPTVEVSRALELADLPTDRWLPYFRGGGERWEVRRSRAEVRAVLGEATGISGDGRTLEVTRAGGVERLPCERARAALRLPGCPTEAAFEGETVRLRGRGRGHGLGLDVEAAKRSGLPANELLRRAYAIESAQPSGTR
jgi:hypothetical protein